MKKRKDSFFGIHCDYHAQPWMGTVGKTLTEEDIRKVCQELKPDYWQIDCKGHFGYTSYPSSLGNAMPDFAFDTLKLYRKVTREEGVALFMHYSGVIDEKYCKEHPETRALHADGTLNQSRTYPSSNYVDDLLIPQLSELAENYQVNGIWVDGDCWGVEIDYHEETLAAFQKETGIDLQGKIPKTFGDPYFEEYREYNRELFRRYLRHYTDTLHAKYPDLEITSNWSFSVHMPEAVCANVDFLSGDNSPVDSLHMARFASRFMPQQNMPWDIMGMGQKYANSQYVDLLPLHPVQIMQQAAAVISLGGAFQVGISCLFDNSPNMTTLRSFKPLAEFMRARESYCFKGKPIPQVAMLLSTYDRHLEKQALFTLGDDESKRGLTALLCDCGQSLEIIAEHTLKEKLTQYSMFVVPEIIEDLASETVELLLDYAKNGGSLLLVGAKTCKIFSFHGAPFAANDLHDNVPTEFEHFLNQQHEAKDQRFFTIDGTAMGGVLSPVEILADGGDTIAQTCYSVKEFYHPFAVIKDFGKGKIAAIGADIGKAYNLASQYLHRNVMNAICEKMYTPLAKIENALGLLEIVCLEKDGKLMLQLVNANGNHSNWRCATEDFIPPVLDIRLSIAFDTPPKKLLLQPNHQEIPFEYKNGRAYFEIDRVYIHNVVEVIK